MAVIFEVHPNLWLLSTSIIVCVCACVRVHVRACVYVCVWVLWLNVYNVETLIWVVSCICSLIESII